MCFSNPFPRPDAPQTGQAPGQRPLTQRDLFGSGIFDPRIKSGFEATKLTGPRGRMLDNTLNQPRLLGG